MVPVFLSALLALAAPAGPLPWARDYGEAVKQAKAAARPVMIDFWASWCTWCHELDRTTYADSRVLERALGFVPVKVNTEGNGKELALTERYDVRELPTVLFATPEGRTVLRVERFLGPEPFAETLETARRAAADVMAWEKAIATNPKDPAALARLGQHLFEQRAEAESLELLRAAAERDAASPAAERRTTRQMLAVLHARRKRYAKAEAALQEAGALAPAGELDPRLVEELERAYRDAGKIAPSAGGK